MEGNKMNVCRSIFEMGLISKQFKRETGKEFDLNELIKWLGKRKLIHIDDDIYENHINNF